MTIDTGVYDRVRAFRAPNSRHPKTGFHKRRLTFGELCGPLDAILDLARTPTPFDLPPPPADRNGPLADLWQYAVDQVAAQTEAKAQRRAAGNGATTLNRQTLAFIREGAAPGDRHRLLFSAAANLGEFGCPLALATALLRESGLDSGLPPREVDRQIRCGLEGAEVGDATQPAAEASPPDWPPAESQAIVGTRPQDPPCRYCGSTAFFETALPDGRIAIGCCKDGLPPRTLSIGQWRDRCRCGSDQVVEVAISDGRTRIDCRNCGKFLRFGRWYTPEEVNA